MARRRAGIDPGLAGAYCQLSVLNPTATVGLRAWHTHCDSFDGRAGNGSGIVVGTAEFSISQRAGQSGLRVAL
jgi:hypothetical protein